MRKKIYESKEIKDLWHGACGLLRTCSVFILVFSFCVSGCGGKNFDHASKSDNTLYLGTYQKPEPFIYPMITGSITFPLIDIVFSRLFTLTTDGVLHPELAEKWEVLEEGKKFVIHLRPDAKFHDGKNVTAKDVVETVNWLRNPEKSKRAYVFSSISGIKALDEHTIEIVIIAPAQDFLSAVLYNAPIYPAHLLTENSGQEVLQTFGRQPIGSGPFQLSSWSSDDTITLTAFPDYFGGRSKLARVVVKKYPSKLHLFNAFVRGDVDWLERIDSTDYETIKDDASFQTLKELAPGGYALQFNFHSLVFKDFNVRKAVTLAINRKQIIDILESGNGEPMFGPFSNKKFRSEEKDNREKAKELLNQSGWKLQDGFLTKEGAVLRMILIVEKGSSHQIRLAKLIRQQLNEIGIQVNIKPVNGLDKYVVKLKGSSNWDFLLFMYLLTKDYYYCLKHYFQSDAVANTGDFKNEDLDQLLINESEDNLEVFHQKINSILDHEMPICSIYSPYSFTIASNGVSGFDQNYFNNTTPFMGFIKFEKIKSERR